jgi:hypothetical protein
MDPTSQATLLIQLQTEVQTLDYASKATLLIQLQTEVQTLDYASKAALLIQLQTEVQTLDYASKAALLIQLQTEVQTLQAAAAAAVPPTGLLKPPVFTLAPALDNTTTFLDLTSSTGAMYFKGATKPLNTQPFGFADPSDLQIFLDLVLKKLQIWGWNTIFIISVTDPVTTLSTSRNLLSEYGTISLESVRTQVTMYYATSSREAQDSFMASLTLNFLKLINIDSKVYHLSPIVAADGPVPSGPLLLKLIISQAHIELDSNIEPLNFYIKAQTKSLSARGETSSNLLIRLFKGYKAAADVEFLELIRRNEDNAYEEGEDVDTNDFMADALLKFKAGKLVGKRYTPTKEQGQILALTAQVEQLKSAKQLSKKVQMSLLTNPRPQGTTTSGPGRTPFQRRATQPPNYLKGNSITLTLHSIQASGPVILLRNATRIEGSRL